MKDNTPSKDQLLKTRYKCIAAFPYMEDYSFSVGEISDRDWGFGGDDDIGYKSRISDYPHLFKKMEWWEERKAEELPQYVISGYGKIYKVASWDGVNNEGVPMFWYKTQEGQTTANNVKWLHPSDETEYQQYLNSLTK